MPSPGEFPQAFAVDYEQAPAYWSIGILWNVLISAERSFGQFTLMDQTMPEGAGPPAHIHERMAEGFYIPDGEIRYEVGAEKAVTVGRPGTAVWIPPGTPHAFKVTSHTARALNFYTSGGFDDQFPFLAAPAAETVLPPPDAAGPPDAERREACLEASATCIRKPGSPVKRSGSRRSAHEHRASVPHCAAAASC